MCRRNQLYGWILMAFGLGLLIGRCLDGSLLSGFAAFLIICAGLWVMRQK